MKVNPRDYLMIIIILFETIINVVVKSRCTCLRCCVVVYVLITFSRRSSVIIYLGCHQKVFAFDGI